MRACVYCVHVVAIIMCMCHKGCLFTKLNKLTINLSTFRLRARWILSACQYDYLKVNIAF